MYVKKSRNLEFLCGGTLISEQIILTAAHCIHQNNNYILTKDTIVLNIGRFDIDDWNNKDYMTPTIKKIVVHPDYKRFKDWSFDADIALITLEQTIDFTTSFIRPACLWNGSTKLSKIVSTTGIVVGWGNDESGVPTSKPNKVEMPIVSKGTCLASQLSYKDITSDRTFCAGKRDGSGPCSGDSGGGLTININGRWYLRGIVSISLFDKATNSCDVGNYTVFTDVAKFLPWVISYF